MHQIVPLLCAVLLISPSAFADEAAAPPSLPSVRSLFTDLGQDVVHLANVRTVEVLAVGGGTAAAVSPFDTQLTAHAATPTVTEDVLDPGQVIGNGALQVGGALTTFAIGRLTHRPEVAIFGSELFRAQVLNGAITAGVKLAVQRTRPDSGPYSFPSGHSSATFATATVIEHEFGWKAGLAAYGVAAYVAASRLTENQHFTSDVIFGAAIGIVSAHAVTLGHGRTRVGVAPFASPTSRGIEFVVM
jgi:membrane-associated phospholipid phosphatase